MIFTGKNLHKVRRGIVLALGEIHNEIATCPDVTAYADDIEALEYEHEQFTAMLARIDTELAPAKGNQPNLPASSCGSGL